MARISKKLQQMKDIFSKNEFDFELLEDISVLNEFKEIFENVSDKRHPSYIKHSLKDIVMITLLAVLSNAN